MLRKALGLVFEPEDIWQNHPRQVHNVGCCCWGVWGTDSHGRSIAVHSWDTMGDVVRHGLTFRFTGATEVEVGYE
jgi:hypothetical protein